MKKDSLLARFNRRVPYPVRLLVVAALGLSMLPLVQGAQFYGVLIYQGLMKTEPPCSVVKVLQAPSIFDEFARVETAEQEAARIVAQDAELGIVEVSTRGRSFWIKKTGAEMDGLKLIPYLVAEHAWMRLANPAETVQPGDTVIDCGAHVGTFAADALARGAKQVIAIEPDETNIECLRRNFRNEIADRRLVLVPKAAWSEETMLKFTVSDANSGMGSAVIKTGTREIEVPATTIDAIIRDYGIDRVDYLKMDIEGAERHALKGGLETLKRFRPRLMLESYHLPDDPVVLPGILRQAHADYREICGPCERRAQYTHWRPYVLYFQ